MSGQRHHEPSRAGRPTRKAEATLLVCLSLLFARADLAQTSVYFSDDMAYGEQEVKAAYLYHFGTYVQWPNDSAEAITIALLEADGLDFLQEFLVDRTIAGRPVSSRRLSSISEITDEQIVFIGRSANSRLEELLMALDGRPILVVTDTPDGLRDGAIINFLLVDDRVRFEVSLRSARRAGLMLSSRLLSAALNVQEDEA